MSDTATQTVV